MLEFVFLFSGHEDDSFGVLVELFKSFEQSKLKGQRTTTKQTSNLLSGVKEGPCGIKV